MLQSLTGFPPPVRCWFAHVVPSEGVCLHHRSVAIYRRTFKSLASTNFAIGAVAPRAGNIYTRPP
ncbi:Outer membrane receptor protein [Pseudomonas syringae pv. actinidiae]|uniref:Outer membrane receptor protein n=1 Tax=Pseudomonas syringae pv. actinidiae TaxID=103796 RepID=A0AAN4TMP9_PSESF|nr:Outer membrane receptor protein [Pseudomonas syringae pv. actinidiae]